MKKLMLLIFIASSWSLAQTGTGFEPLKQDVIDINRAFISPFEFSQAFGGRFEPRSGETLFWEFNGVQLLLKKNSATVSSLLDQKSFDLVRPVQVKNNRTVLEATVLYHFNCSISPTSESQTIVTITCGAGESLQVLQLKRY